MIGEARYLKIVGGRIYRSIQCILLLGQRSLGRAIYFEYAPS
jgi:hypothetical protein